VSNAAADVAGCGDELGSIEVFLGAVDTGPAVFVVQGEPGMGKTTMWRAAVDRARGRGLRVLIAAPAVAEAHSAALEVPVPVPTTAGAQPANSPREGRASS
jgi:AAA domain